MLERQAGMNKQLIKGLVSNLVQMFKTALGGSVQPQVESQSQIKELPTDCKGVIPKERKKKIWNFLEDKKKRQMRTRKEVS